MLVSCPQIHLSLPCPKVGQHEGGRDLEVIKLDDAMTVGLASLWEQNETGTFSVLRT